MKAKKGSVHMAGEKMEILFDAGCVRNFRPEKAMALPKITGLLCKALRRRDVSRKLIRNVRIGETIVFADRCCGYTYQLRIEAHAIYVLGVWKWAEEPTRDFLNNVVYLMGDAFLKVTPARVVAA